MFFRLLRYPTKNLPQYKQDANNFMDSCGVLFDVYCNDPAQRKKYELKYGLKMKQWEYNFIEDQRGPRLEWCSTKSNTTSEKSDERFKRDLNSQETRERNR